MKRYKTVDEYIDNSEYWQEELLRLREILLTNGTGRDGQMGRTMLHV